MACSDPLHGFCADVQEVSAGVCIRVPEGIVLFLLRLASAHGLICYACCGAPQHKSTGEINILLLLFLVLTDFKK